MTTKIKDNIKTALGIHSCSCDTAVYVPGGAGGQPVDMLVDTGSAVTIKNCRVLEKAKLGMVTEPSGEPALPANR